MENQKNNVHWIDERMVEVKKDSRSRANSLTMLPKPETPPLVRTSSFKNKNKGATPRNAWGNKTYAELICDAINSSEEKKLKLSEIYAWFVENVPYFKDKGDADCRTGWKNSIRHNLSLHNRFYRILSDEVKDISKDKSKKDPSGKSGDKFVTKSNSSWWAMNLDIPLGRSSRKLSKSIGPVSKPNMKEAAVMATTRVTSIKNTSHLVETPKAAPAPTAPPYTVYSPHIYQTSYMEQQYRQRSFTITNPAMVYHENPRRLSWTNDNTYYSQTDNNNLIRPIQQQMNSFKLETEGSSHENDYINKFNNDLKNHDQYGYYYNTPEINKTIYTNCHQHPDNSQFNAPSYHQFAPNHQVNMGRITEEPLSNKKIIDLQLDDIDEVLKKIQAEDQLVPAFPTVSIASALAEITEYRC